MTSWNYALIGMISVLIALNSTTSAHAEIDQRCLQGMLGQQNKRLQLCKDKFQEEHRGLCETAATQAHERNARISKNGARQVPRPAGYSQVAITLPRFVATCARARS